MKGLLFAFLALTGSAYAAELTVQDRYLTQPVDRTGHRKDTYQQHVQILVPPGTPKDAPVMFFIGNELGQTAETLKYAAGLYGKGRQMIFIQADHRGYGSYSNDADQTIPTYVNVTEAIEDFHHAVQTLRQEFSGPFIVAGYSYGGMIATKMISKYPGDADVVLSSSAVNHWPLLYDGHDQTVEKAWPAGLYENLAKRIEDLKPAKLFDQNWQDRRNPSACLCSTMRVCD